MPAISLSFARWTSVANKIALTAFSVMPTSRSRTSVNQAGPAFTRIRAGNRLDGHHGFASKSSRIGCRQHSCCDTR